MAAGVRDQHLMRAAAARDLHLRAGLRAAVLHRRQRPRVFSGEAMAVLRPQVRREACDDRGKPDHVTCPLVIAKLSITVDPFDGAMLGLVGQVGEADGGENRVMAEVFLHLDQIDAGLDQVSGVGVATVRGDLFFRPQASTTLCRVVCTPPRSMCVVASAAPGKPP